MRHPRRRRRLLDRERDASSEDEDENAGSSISREDIDVDFVAGAELKAWMRRVDRLQRKEGGSSARKPLSRAIERAARRYGFHVVAAALPRVIVFRRARRRGTLLIEDAASASAGKGKGKGAETEAEEEEETGDGDTATDADQGSGGQPRGEEGGGSGYCWELFKGSVATAASLALLAGANAAAAGKKTEPDLRRMPQQGSTGGVYLLRSGDGQDGVAVWKPAAEEDKRSAEQRSLRGPLRQGVAAGDGAIREVAAYLLDAASGGTAGVTPTALARLGGGGTAVGNGNGGGLGSLQKFVPHECSAEDMGATMFATDDVHQIGLLDLRVFNLDRHEGNFLVSSSGRLVPIDHGLCLPPVTALGEAEFGWLHWRQAKQPFSAATREWVAGLSEEEDAALLRRLGLPEDCVTTARVCVAVLKRCVAAGLTLHQIGSMFMRPGLGEDPSVLELLVHEARTAMGNDELGSDIVPHVVAALPAKVDALLS